ncbi:MAG TPA: FAD-dependent oxidoreductase [Gemmatimonadales bacterium]|nr:FAD-dependent oxidoreductase [Gemmatimonadales bacterium]
MDLTSGTPLWPTLVGIPAAYPSLRRDRRCDVAVIGGGITGALVAHRFAREGIHVVLVEAREVARGSTAATTALIQYEIDTHLVDLVERVGADHAVRSYRLCLDAVRGIEALAATGGDGCGWRAKQSLYLSTRRRDRRTLEQEWLARRSAGIETELLSERDIRSRFSFARPAALLSPVAGEVDAYRLTHKLLLEGTRHGLEVYDRTPVVKYASGRSGVDLETESGARVRARKAVFATGYETPEFLGRSLVTLVSTFAFATEPLGKAEGWGEDRCLIWETARPYFYARTTSDGRAVVGGADVPFATAHKRSLVLRKQCRRLEVQFRKMFPGITGDVDWRWSGTFGETGDGLPFIGTARQFPHGYFALGYGGNGITFSWIAANLLLDLFLGRPNPDTELFRFDRQAVRR